jgi:flagellar hook-associated protein 3 FlgL
MIDRFSSSFDKLGALRDRIPSLQSEIAKAARELSTSRVNDIGLVLGSRTAFVNRLSLEQRSLESILTTNRSAQTRLAATDGALQSMVTVLQALQDDAVAAMSGDSDVAVQVLVQRAHVALAGFSELANTTVNGYFIFGGLNGGQQPFHDPGSLAFAAAQQAIESDFQATFGFSSSDHAVSNLSNSAIASFVQNNLNSFFQPAQWGSLFSDASGDAVETRIGRGERLKTSVTLAQDGFRQAGFGISIALSVGIEKQSASSQAATLDLMVRGLGSSIAELTDMRSRMGLATERITGATEHIELRSQFFQTAFDAEISVDPAEAATRLADLSSKLEAAFAATARLQQLSIISFLR